MGKSTYIYAAVLEDGGDERRKARLCPACGQETFGRVQTRFQNALSELWPAPDDDQTCIGCEAELDGDSEPIFVTIYSPKSERLDFYGRAHPACGRRVLPGLTAG